jgi:hypothetical protein
VSGFNALECSPGVFAIPNEGPLATEPLYQMGPIDGSISETDIRKCAGTMTSRTSPLCPPQRITDDGVAARKVDEYPDGRMNFADGSRSTGTTILSERLCRA